MIISCPSCGASFNIKPEALGPNGRSVKCSKCAHRWHATADEDAPEAQAAAPAPAAAATPAADPESPPAADANADTAPAPIAEAPQPDEEAAPATESAAGADDTPNDEPNDEPAIPETPPTGMREALGLAGDSDTAEDEDEVAPSRSRRRSKATARKPRRSAARVLSIFVLLLAVCSAAGAAVFMKNEIMIWLPATERLYAMVGMGPAVLGRGLQIVEPQPKKEVDGNDEILIVEGEIRNITEKPVEVPLMRGALLDAQGKELHIWTFTAAKSRIAPGELARYRTEFRNPPPEAQSLDITFTRGTAEPPDTAKHDAKSEHEQDGGMMTESTAQHH
jgi:predicted Zn finger-like uncharacterized protein